MMASSYSTTPDCIPPSQEATGSNSLTRQFSHRRKLQSPDFSTDSSAAQPVDNEGIICDRVKRSVDQIDVRSEDATPQTYMSALKHAGWLAVAYYDTEECQIFMMPDVLETPNNDYLKKAKAQINPDVIITSSKQGEDFVDILKGVDDDNKNVYVEILPSMAFAFEACKRRILNINGLPGLPNDSTDDKKLIFFNSLMSFDHENMVKVTGALLKYLEKRRVGVELEDVGTRVPILALKTFNLDDMMSIDSNSYSALQIFQKEVHPSVYKTGARGGQKEGLSLFGIMNHTKSSLGSKLLRVWFLHPSMDQNVLEERQRAIAYFLSPKNLEYMLALQDSLKHFKNLTKVLSRMLCAGVSITDWQNLYKTIYHAICIGDACSGLRQDIGIIRKISLEFTEDLYKIANLINKIIFFEESISTGRFVVREGVDEQLDEKKRTYNGLPDLMTKVAQEELNRLDEAVSECSVIYLPQLGYLLAIPLSPEMKEEEDFQINGLEFMPSKTVSKRLLLELDSLLGDTQCEITDHETAIMHRLQSVILEHTNLLVKVLDLAAELDCLLALAIAAKEGNYVCPKLTNEFEINITAGRHPLQELCVSQFVPNDVIFDTNSGRIKILTGPNASGKSVYLKQTGLIIFLAHIGSFVPAEAATIGITDAIFTRIHSRETISVPLSTFMIDINQMATALNNATSKSLVIVDEFGKGTASIDGLSLLAASIQYWSSLNMSCPRVLISTHFFGLDKDSLLVDSPCLQFQTMEVLQDEEDLVFLYHVMDGYTAYSYASQVARTAGVPEDVVKRGEEVAKLIAKNKEINKVGSVSGEAQQERFSRIVNKFLELDLDKCDVYSFLKNFVVPVAEGKL